MGVVKQQAFKNSVVIYLGLVLGYLNVVILFPRFLSPEEFGLTRLLLSFSNVLSIVSLLGFNNVAVRYFPYFKSPEQKHNGFLFLLLTVPFAGFVICMLLLYFFESWLTGFFKDNSPLFVKYFYLVAPITFFQLYLQLLLNYSKAIFKPVVALFFKEVGIRVLVLIALIFTFYGLISFNDFLILFSLAYGLPVLGLMIYLICIREFPVKPSFGNLNFSYLKEMVKYGLYGQGTLIANVLTHRIDVLMLGGLVGGKGVAIYTIAFYISEVIMIPQKGMSHILGPMVSEAFSRWDLKQIVDLYKRSALNQLLVGSIVFLLIWFSIEEILSLSDEEYLGGVYVFFFVGMAKLFAMGLGINHQVILHSKFYKYNLLFVGGLLVLTVVFNLIFIPILGLIGAALGTALALVGNNLAKSGFVWMKYGIHPFSKSYLVLLGIIMITGGVGCLLPSITFFEGSSFYSNILNIAYKSIVLATLYGLLVVLLKPSTDVWETLLKLKERFL